jgi:hypothetical protein
MHFVADLDPSDARRCTVETRWDELLKKQITFVRYIDGVTTTKEFESAFRVFEVAHGLRVRSDVKLDENGGIVPTEMPWPAGILDRMRDPARQVHLDIEVVITSDELLLSVRDGRRRLDGYAQHLAQFAYDPDSWRTRQLARRDARQRRRSRKARRGW